ncbi:hypothetical protein C1H46_007382 [Malus baccata]|uniref:Uncharacterized protein n=1 Tax=Malus baccata TaxID=106549 RepID=A0A540N7G4_MALBA|nr:hypothetical protein C1H46_007382 [Malus baccata]
MWSLRIRFVQQCRTIVLVLSRALLEIYARGREEGVMDQLLCNYTLDDTNEELLKLMDEALKRGYKQSGYNVERNGRPAE